MTRPATRSNAVAQILDRAWNDDPKPFVWKKTAEEILDSLSRYLQRTSGAGH